MKTGWFYRLKLEMLAHITHNIFCIPEGNVLPKGLLILQRVMFPLESLVLYLRRDVLSYDFITDTFTVYGVKYSSYFFRVMRDLKQSQSVIVDKTKIGNRVRLQQINMEACEDD